MEAQLPPDNLPEICFVGRSNVGKSRLINALTSPNTVRDNKRTYVAAAPTSDTPGHTRSLDFYKAGDFCHFVDMPGYGYAEASIEDKDRWRALILKYVTTRKALKRVFVLVDSRLGTLKESDKEFLKLLQESRVHFQVILTKCDLIHPDGLAKRYTLLQEDLNLYRPNVEEILMVSAKSNAGVDRIRRHILRLVGKV
jgi:ribosome biogenesis GTP-binding protein YsxC/EngB